MGFLWLDSIDRPHVVAGLACLPLVVGGGAAVMTQDVHVEHVPQASVRTYTLPLAGFKLSTATASYHAFLPTSVTKL
jgi:hypothetical protein